MIDIRLFRENPDLVRENIKKKFQDHKLVLVDEIIDLDVKSRQAQVRADELRAEKNKISKSIGAFMAQKDVAAADKAKLEVADINKQLEELEPLEAQLSKELTEKLMLVPNIIDKDVPIGKDDSENVEIEKYGEPVVPDFDIPYHTEIMKKLSYCIPPYMIRSKVVTGVMSFAEMDAMMYKIEGEDLYLIGTSEHSMIGKFIDTINDEAKLPYTLTSYSPCFRKEKGAHGIEERGVYRIHQFEKQEMIVVCKPEESAMWYDKLWQNTVDFFRSLDIPVRTLACCSGDLADLKVKSCDVEAWSPRQKKYFEVGSCSNLGEAQARRLKIRVKSADGERYFAHTLNNTVVAPPRMLIAFLENNLNADGSVNIPEVLRPYMGGKSVIK